MTITVFPNGRRTLYTPFQQKTAANNKWRIIRTDTYRLIAYEDNTDLYVNDVFNQTLSARAVTSVSLSYNDVIYGKDDKGIMLSTDTGSTTGLCYAWAGTKFAYNVSRNNIVLYMVAIGDTATVTVTDATGAGTVLLNAGSVTNSSITTVNTYSSKTILVESDLPIAAYKGIPASVDDHALYPANTIIYGGFSSGDSVTSTEDNTSYTVYSSAGTTASATITNAGRSSGTIIGAGSQYSGPMSVVVADKPVCAQGFADGDGGQTTAFVGKDGFGTHFGIPEDENEFTVIISDVAANYTIYNSAGTQVGTGTLAGNAHGGGIYFARVTGSTLAGAGTLVVTDQPCCAIYEGESDDEQNVAAGVLGLGPDTFNYGQVVVGGPSYVTDGLILNLDAGNLSSYSGEGSTWTDLSTSSNDATLTGLTFDASDGGGSLVFGGGSDQASLGSSVTLNNTAGTLTFAVKRDVTSYRTFLLGSSSTVNMLEFQSNYMRTETGNNCNTFDSTNFNFTADDWFVFTVTFDNQKSFWWVNETSIGETPDYGLTNCAEPAATNLIQSFVWQYIGKASTYATGFEGKLAFLRQYNTVLTDEQVRQNYRAVQNRFSLNSSVSEPTPDFGPDYTIDVTNNGASAYTLSGSDMNGAVSGDNPSLSFLNGDKVLFQVNASTSSAHPFYIKTAATTGTGDQASGVTGNGTTVVEWTIPAAGTYYYICAIHSAMVGTITVT